MLFMDNLKSFSKSKEEIDRLVTTVQAFSTNTGIKFGMKKCGIITIKKKKVLTYEGLKVPNSQQMKDVENEGYTHLGRDELDKTKEHEMKEKTIKEYWLALIRPKIKTKWEKLNNSNKCMGSGCIQMQNRNTSESKESELKDVDRKLRKTMIMYRVLTQRVMQTDST